MEKLESSKSTVRPIYGSNRNETMYVYSKDEFFLRFQETVRRLAHGDLLVMMGDMNARVGNDTGVWGEVLGRQGEEVCHENGRRLLQFRSEHNLQSS